jgi:hypothetical protein
MRARVGNRENKKVFSAEAFVPKPIVMREHFHVTAHSQVFSWPGDGVSQTDGKSNLHVFRDVENPLHLFFQGIARACIILLLWKGMSKKRVNLTLTADSYAAFQKLVPSVSAEVDGFIRRRVAELSGGPTREDAEQCEDLEKAR